MSKLNETQTANEISAESQCGFGQVDFMVVCKCHNLPTKNMYKETQYSTIPRRSGKESVPFLGLEPGIHTVKFYTDKKSITVKVKTWISMYGNAWIILNT